MNEDIKTIEPEYCVYCGTKLKEYQLSKHKQCPNNECVIWQDMLGELE